MDFREHKHVADAIHRRKAMNKQTHKEIHIALHKSLDEIVANFISHTKALPTKTTVFELMEWSYQQTINPTKIK